MLRSGVKSQAENRYFLIDFLWEKHYEKENLVYFNLSRFELENDGSYSKLPEIAELYFDSHILPKVFAIAAGKSGTKNVLYYSYSVHTFYVKRIEWSGDSFTSANFNNLWQIEGPQSTDDYTSFTSIAANQDGLFVGEYDYNDAASKYTIRVKKYLHNATGYGNSSGTVTIVDEAHLVADIEEILNALYIQDGVLYGLTTKTKKEKNSGGSQTILFAQSGRLFKVGNTGSFPTSGNAVKLHGDDDVEDDSDGSFAPYRFIAVKPNKLVIASDGAYGAKESTNAENKNRVWTFTPDSSGDYTKGSSVDTHNSVTFSIELEWDPHNGFEWK